MAIASTGSALTHTCDSLNCAAAVGSCFARAARARYPRWSAVQYSSIGSVSGHPRWKRGVRRFRPRRHLFQGDGQARDPRFFVGVWVRHFTDALPQPLGDREVEQRHLLLDAPPIPSLSEL